MESKRKAGGSNPHGYKAKDAVIRVANEDKPLAQIYISLLDNPCTRSAAIEALDMVRQLGNQAYS
jgi:hypothetical protein